ncbi:MAG: glycosyltransferase, partial [Candidatus Thermoplasmatota archaeon]|nr:glycosyltransferase [Candidatus Thermoplasmatota archaeon]
VKEQKVFSVRDSLERALPISTSQTTLECLASGIPTILSTVGGQYSGVDFNDLGVVVSDNNPDDIVSALDLLLENPDRAGNMGGRAKDYVNANRSWKKVAECFEEVYRKL